MNSSLPSLYKIQLVMFLIVIFLLTGCGTKTVKTDADLITRQYLETGQSDNVSFFFPDIPDLRFSDLDGLEFWFGSGAGAWSTIVKILPDGAFSGFFYDSDMGDIGEGYPGGTRYECHFTGKFSSLVKTGDYEYSMRCVSLTMRDKVGKEEIIDNKLIIYSEPYGFDNAADFSLYLPGKKVSELSKGFLRWTHWSVKDGMFADYGLYNIQGDKGFAAPKNNNMLKH
jgi:hypothetical protein